MGKFVISADSKAQRGNKIVTWDMPLVEYDGVRCSGVLGIELLLFAGDMTELLVHCHPEYNVFGEDKIFCRSSDGSRVTFRLPVSKFNIEASEFCIAENRTGCHGFDAFMKEQLAHIKKSIDDNKWFLSEKAGKDVGMDMAESNFIEHHLDSVAKNYRSYFCGTKCSHNEDCNWKKAFSP